MIGHINPETGEFEVEDWKRTSPDQWTTTDDGAAGQSWSMNPGVWNVQTENPDLVQPCSFHYGEDWCVLMKDHAGLHDLGYDEDTAEPEYEELPPSDHDLDC